MSDFFSIKIGILHFLITYNFKSVWSKTDVFTESAKHGLFVNLHTHTHAHAHKRVHRQVWAEDQDQHVHVHMCEGKSLPQTH